MINLGIIGFGGISKSLHIPAIRKSKKFQIKAVADVFPDNGTAEKLGIPKYYTDYKELLADKDIDAVLISSPHDCHEEHCVAAFNAKKHVIIEKPIARNLAEAKNIIDAANKAGTIGMIGFGERFFPEHVYIKNLIKENKFGKLLSARIDHYQNFRPPLTSWWRDGEKAGGGAVIGSGVHRLDLLRWFLGEPVSVYAQAVKMPERLSAEACAHAVITFDSGVIANFSINWAIYDYIYCEGFTLSGEKGMIMTAPEMKLGLSEIDNGVMKNFKAPACKSMYETFAECIENNVQPESSLSEGYNSLKLVRAIYKSIETNSVINPDTITF